MTKTIAFLGAGNMASALIHGLIVDGFPAQSIWACDPDEQKIALLQRTTGINVSTNNSECARHANTIVLAVKPQILATLCQDVRTVVAQTQPLVISIAAGIPCAAIQNWLVSDLALVRTMPNTPASINCGATGLYATPRVSVEQKDTAESLMRAVGLIAWVSEESHLDIVTALSGSGPAYYFLMMEAMEKAATELGLPQDTARILTLQTAFGAAKMALESEEDVATLRQRVTSPGGTTERAINTFQEGHFTDLVANAISAANTRAQELASQFGGK